MRCFFCAQEVEGELKSFTNDEPAFGELLYVEGTCCEWVSPYSIARMRTELNQPGPCGVMREDGEHTELWSMTSVGDGSYCGPFKGRTAQDLIGKPVGMSLPLWTWRRPEDAVLGAMLSSMWFHTMEGNKVFVSASQESAKIFSKMSGQISEPMRNRATLGSIVTQLPDNKTYNLTPAAMFIGWTSHAMMNESDPEIANMIFNKRVSSVFDNLQDVEKIIESAPERFRAGLRGRVESVKGMGAQLISGKMSWPNIVREWNEAPDQARSNPEIHEAFTKVLGGPLVIMAETAIQQSTVNPIGRRQDILKTYKEARTTGKNLLAPFLDVVELFWGP